VLRWVWAFIDRPLERFEESATFWATVTESTLSPRRGDDLEFATLLSAEGTAYVKLQGVHDGGGAHPDFEVENIPEAVRKARGLGAAVVDEVPGLSVMRSPAGQLFCLVPLQSAGGIRPPVVTGPDGAGSRLDQVSIDIGPAEYEDEAAFWSGLTGWELRPTGLPEFRRLRPPASLPIQIVLQRLGEERPASSHVDLACSDIEVTRAWHEKHGARVVNAGPGCTVMRDPAGGTYCLTGRDPATGLRPV
jgi:Glyoxalase-like domain